MVNCLYKLIAAPRGFACNTTYFLVRFARLLKRVMNWTELIRYTNGSINKKNRDKTTSIIQTHEKVTNKKTEGNLLRIIFWRGMTVQSGIILWALYLHTV